MGTPKVVTAGDVSIIEDKIELFNFDYSKKLNIKNLIRSIDFFASIDNNTLCADIYIAEGIELLTNFPIRGEEWISINFQTPQEGTPIRCTFFVDKVSEIRSSENGNLRSYVLRCSTEDYLKNSYMMYSKKYNNGYVECINDILNNEIGTRHSINIEGTKGIFDYMVNRVRPFQAIDLIKERAISDVNKSSLFYFFQQFHNTMQYNFCTLEHLMKKSSTRKYVYKSNERAKDLGEQNYINSILSYEILNRGDSVSKVMNGAIRNQIKEFNIKTGEYFKTYEYNKSDGSYHKLDGSKDFNSSSYLNMVTEKPALVEMVVKDPTREENFHNENIHWKRPYESRVNQFSMRIRVYGDTNVDVGHVIDLEFPEVTGAEKKIERVYSGKYLIIELCHRFDKRDTGTFEHYMILKVIKTHMKE